jgi:cytochrome o ubiquinol oxidase subunit 2
MNQTKKSFFTPWKIALFVLFVAIIIGLGLFLLLSGKNIAVLNPQGVVAGKQKDLIIFTTLLGMVIIIPVFVMLFAFAWKFREGNKKAKYTPEVSGSRWLETIWWAIPIAIIAILSVVTWYSSHDLDPYRQLASEKKPIRVQVVALQWKWLFIYPDQGVASVNELRFPEKTPVNFEITADAPMSAFWIPNLGSQTYAMNGMSSKLSLEADKIGEYRGSNSNINGKGYADMNFKAIVTSQQDFTQWTKDIFTPEDHLDLMMSTYEELAKPSEKYPVKYYMLHDQRLYDKILNKYMQHGSDEPNETMDHDSMNYDHEGMTH